MGKDCSSGWPPVGFLDGWVSRTLGAHFFLYHTTKCGAVLEFSGNLRVKKRPLLSAFKFHYWQKRNFWETWRMKKNIWPIQLPNFKNRENLIFGKPEGLWFQLPNFKNDENSIFRKHEGGKNKNHPAFDFSFQISEMVRTQFCRFTSTFALWVSQRRLWYQRWLFRILFTARVDTVLPLTWMATLCTTYLSTWKDLENKIAVDLLS